MIHLLWAIPASAAVGVIWLAAAIANFKFGLSQGTNAPETFLLWTVTSSQVNAYASLAIDILKTAMVIAASLAFAARAWVLATTSSMIFVLCFAWSSQNAIGYVLSERAAAIDGRGQTADQWGALKAEYDEAMKRRRMVPDARPETVVRADIARLEADPAFTRTKACSDATKPDSITFCERWRGVQAEIAASASASLYDAKLDRLRGELDSRKRVTSAEPLMAVAASVFGAGERTVETGRSVAYASLVELVAAFGLASIWGAFMLAWRKRYPIHTTAFAQPEPDKLPERHEPPAQPRKQEPLPMPQKKRPARPRAISRLWGSISRLWSEKADRNRNWGPRLVKDEAEVDSQPTIERAIRVIPVSKEESMALRSLEDWIGTHWRKSPDGEKTTVVSAHRHYTNWCLAAGFENPLPAAPFVTGLEAYGIMPKDMRGRGKVIEGVIFEPKKRAVA
jgi:hypothetical protein